MNVIDTWTCRVVHRHVTDTQADAVCDLLNGVIGPDGRYVASNDSTGDPGPTALAGSGFPVWPLGVHGTTRAGKHAPSRATPTNGSARTDRPTK